ncbi:MAG TPA: hypothetical protein VMU65_05010 [Candidatus Saccharimonadales bacterium]|nr:hypothetical protein [Candidatus Saccharimonadales bacterium]
MYRTQPAVSVEAAFLVVVEVSDDDGVVDESVFPASDFDPDAPLSELLPELLPDGLESPLSDMIADDAEPRLSVL